MAAALGAERIATGHYARIRRDRTTGRYLLLRGVDPAKDQTYFLFGLTQAQLARTLFPLGEYTKAEVRRMAEEMGLPVAAQEREPGDLLRPERRLRRVHRRLLPGAGNRRGPERAGEIVTTDGRVLGEHAGVHHFTVGPAQGPGHRHRRAALRDRHRARHAARRRRAARRICCGGASPCREVNWFPWDALDAPVRAEVKIRNKHEAARGHALARRGRRARRGRFDEPQRAVTPGQAAVFYDGDLVLGGGWIE